MIASKTHGYGSVGAFSNVAKYVRRDESMLREDMQPVLALGCANVSTPETWALEAATAYSLSAARAPTLSHWTISWGLNETVGAEEARDAFDRLREAIGAKDQQALWSLNADGAEHLYHIHACFAGVNPETLRAAWYHEGDYKSVRDTLRQMEMDYGRASGAKGASQAVDAAEKIAVGARLDVTAQRIIDDLTRFQAHFSRQHVTAAIHKANVTDVEHVKELREKVFALSKPLGPDAFTTQAVWNAEERVTKALDNLGTGFCGIEGAEPRKELSEQQVRAFEYALETGARRKLITGVAGAGKSFVVKDVAATFEAAGYNVRAISVTHAACAALEAQTQIPTRTISSELFRWNEYPETKLTADDVLIIDEVSTLGTEQAAELLEAADRAGAMVIGFGDHKQFGSVGYGNVLGEWMRADKGIDLDKTQRQTIDWQRKATEDMRAGRVREALDAYRDHNMIHRHKSQKGARAKLVERWKHYETSGYEVAVSTFSNRERIKLSQQIRAAHRELGGLIGDDVKLDVQDGTLPFAVGERVTIRGNLPDLGLRNGMAATVVGIHGTTLQLQREGDIVDLDTSAGPDHRAIEHGYVATTYREMGSTRTVALNLLTRYENSASFNVAFSRHTHAFETFFSHEHSGSYEHVVQMASHDRVKHSAHEVADIELRKQQQRQAADSAAQERAAKKEAIREAQERAQEIAQEAKRVADEHAAEVALSIADAAAKRVAANQYAALNDVHLGSQAARDPEEAARHARNFAVAQTMLEPVIGTPGEAYLRGRGAIPTSDVAYCANWARDFETLSSNPDGTPKLSRGHGPAVVFLLRDRTGTQVVGAQGRFLDPPIIDGKPLRQWTVGFAKDMAFFTPRARDSSLVSITEGGPDALTMYQHGVPAIGFVGTAPDWLDDVCAWREVIIATDNDKAGNEKAKMLDEAMYSRSTTYRLALPIDSDVNEVSQQRLETLSIELQRARAALFNPLGRAWRQAHLDAHLLPLRTARQAQTNRDFRNPSFAPWEQKLLDIAEARASGNEQQQSPTIRR